MRHFGHILLFLIFLLSFKFSYSTHNRAGEITYEHLSGFNYRFTIVTYTNIKSSTVDRDSLRVDWGDGKKENIGRTSITSISSEIQKNLYVANHVFPGAAIYCVSMEDPNRNAGIKNLPNSVAIPFYIQTCLFILDPQFFGHNNSPILLQEPIDFANKGDTFIHNPNAFDPDGDSLTYELVPCRGAGGP